MKQILKNKPVQCPPFTLIELLVVVAVIAILFGILLPSLNMARKKAQAIECHTNLKQLGLAVANYINEYNDYLPNHTDDDSGSNWFRSVFVCGDYYRNKFAVLHCPLDEGYTGPPSDTSAVFNYDASKHFWSYCYNMRMCDQYPSLTAPSTCRISDFKQPAGTITYLEGDVSDNGVENNGGDGPVDAPGNEPYVRHSEGAYYLFADFHAEWRRSRTFSLPEFTKEAD